MSLSSLPRGGRRAQRLWLSGLCVVTLACAEPASMAPGIPDASPVLGSAAKGRPLVGTMWRVVAIDGAVPALLPDSAQFFRLSDDARGVRSANARVACNYFFANVVALGARVRFTGIGMTRIWCGDVATAVDQQFANGLEKSAYFGVLGDTLWLYDGELRERVRLNAK